jgi:hypothetical protein
VSDPETRAGAGPPSERVDDWELEELDWSGETGPASPDSATGGPAGTTSSRSSRVGLVTGIASGGQPGDGTETSSVVRRRRAVALAAVGLLVVLAVVIPLVVFGGGGSSAEPTAAPTTTARPPTRTQPSATTTTPTTPATTRPNASGPKSLRVALPAGAALRRGSRGSEVRNLQKGLAALGYAAGEPDGVFGRTTEAAVVDFQRSNDLGPDGIVGADTARLLNSALADRTITG